MPRVTYYVILPFIRTPDGDLLAIEAVEAPSISSARYRAQAMVGAKRGDDVIVGAIAFSRTGDPQLGDFEDAVVVGRYGETLDGEGLE